MDMHSTLPTAADKEYRFGPFRFDGAQHTLFRADARVATSRHALAVLAVLLEQPGRLVGVRELIERVWPGDAVQANNLAVHMRKLRMALGDDSRRPIHIATVNGRGYRFVAPVDTRDVGMLAPYALPAPPCRAIGRAGAMDAVLALCARRRLVTIAGPGGIGKTTLALTLARAMAKEGADARFIDLGIHGDARRAIGDALRPGGRTILVLDGCEHLCEASALLLDTMLATMPGLRVLATSRVPLEMRGEALHWLAPLDTQAAIALFAERAVRYRPVDANAPEVAAICARLEGHPLAIELAAQRMDTFSAGEIAARLDERLSLLRSYRHGGLAAAFDYSYAALSASARRVLCGLAVLPDAFGMGAARRVLGSEGVDAESVADGVGELVTSSLLQATPSGCGMRYRMTATVKPYALDKVDEINAQRAIRHASSHCIASVVS